MGIFKTRFLKRLESSIEAFRLSTACSLSLRRPTRTTSLIARSSLLRDFQKAMRFLARDEEDEI